MIPFIVLIFFVIRFAALIYISIININATPPKAHGFVNKPLYSTIGGVGFAMASGTSLITSIILKSAYIFGAGIYLSMFARFMGALLPEVFINILEHIIRNTIELTASASTVAYGNVRHITYIAEVHAYLTPYIRSYDTLFELILDLIIFFDQSGSEHFATIESLEDQYREAGNTLLYAYRELESKLGISIDQSPISLRYWEEGVRD